VPDFASASNSVSLRTVISFLERWINHSLFAAEIRQFGLRICQGLSVFLGLLMEKSNSPGARCMARCFSRYRLAREFSTRAASCGSFDL